MKLKSLTVHGFKSFAHKSELFFTSPITGIVGPNGSGKSNIVEAMRFVLGEQSMKSLRGSSGTDLIFKGGGATRSMNRASASIVFDNSERVFSLSTIDDTKISLDFDEITLSREVYADGQNIYMINGHEVRLKDIIELIASVNIGSSGHHIISQGQADRLLNAHAKERRHMLEDSLGLKIYQYRIKESERKLEKTAENIKESYALRRELAPHIKFLKRQVEKIEQAKEMRTELFGRYMKYLKHQESLLVLQKTTLTQEREKVNYESITIKHTLDEFRATLSQQKELAEEQELKVLEEKRFALLRSKDELSRKIGRIEGMIEVAEQLQKESRDENANQEVIHISLNTIQDFLQNLDDDIHAISEYVDIQQIRGALIGMRTRLTEFVQMHSTEVSVAHNKEHLQNQEQKIEELHAQYSELSEALRSVDIQEGDMRKHIEMLRIRIGELTRDSKGREQEFFALNGQYNALQSQLNMIILREESLDHARQVFQEEIDEAVVLLGETVWQYKQEPTQYDFKSSENLDIGTLVHTLEDERRVIERLKIKIEEVGGGSGADVLVEYNDTVERDQFLEREITDLEHSVEALQNIIDDLKSQLRTEFEAGIQKINTQFDTFFKVMFGGGEAQLSLVSLAERRSKKDGDILEEEGGAEDDSTENENEEVKKEEGVDITVKLPRKKIQKLQMLSGGERSLTSIALLFALTQVNPPPFLVLDETDAALDEANSQRYGDMIETLSKVSQLILVTHNRETMSRAQILYGVTLDAEGASQLLSVKFQDALVYAK